MRGNRYAAVLGIALVGWWGGPVGCPAVGGPERRDLALPEPLFSPAAVAAYRPKGPADCFRQICLEYNSPPRPDFAAGRAFEPALLREFFSQADPVAYAEFCRRINLDGLLLLAVPQGGYTTYLQTGVGEPYPFLTEQRLDFFGRVIQECHARGISVFGYLCIGWNFKAQRDHPGDFPAPGPTAIPTLNGAFAAQAIEYAREILRHYPVDGLRTDILDHNTQARTPGDKAFYRERYGEDLPDRFPSWEREQDFRLASISRFVRRFHAACKEVKADVPIWHNWFNYKNVVDLRDAGVVDIGYEEFADPFATLFVRGLFGTRGMISGKLLQNPQRRLCLALGGRAYDYFPVNRKTALPDQALIEQFRAGQGYYGKDSARWVPPSMDWFETDLAPFYSMVAAIEPYLDDARPVSDLGVVFAEATRFRFPQWKRDAVLEPLKGLCEHYLARNEAIAFLASSQLPRRADLGEFRVLVVPDMSGFTVEELEALEAYALAGGQLLLTGQAMLYDPAGRRLPDFALGARVGLEFERVSPDPAKVVTAGTWEGVPLPIALTNVSWVATRARSGTTLVSLASGDQSWPLVHANKVGRGRCVYLATNGSRELTTAVIDWLRGPAPVITLPPEKRAYLTWQAAARRWILHLLDEGDYGVDLRREYAAPTRVQAQYPAQGWSAILRPGETGVRVIVSGGASNRLVVLE